MKIKGKVLIYKNLFASPVGEKGFVAIGTFNIYNKQLYVNIKSSYFLRKNDQYVIPFERISEEDDGFMFNFSESAAFPQNKKEPLIEDGWIGPFEVEYAMFNWYDFYASMTLEMLRNQWLTYYSQFEFNNASIVVEVKTDRLLSYTNHTLSDVKKAIVMVTKHKEDKEKIQKELIEGGDFIDEQWFKDVLEQDEKDLSILNKILEEKMLNVDYSEMSLSDLESLLSDIDMNDPNADFDKAAKIKKEIEKRKKFITKN